MSSELVEKEFILKVTSLGCKGWKNFFIISTEREAASGISDNQLNLNSVSSIGGVAGTSPALQEEGSHNAPRPPSETPDKVGHKGEFSSKGG